jgi:hypothetical protein
MNSMEICDERFAMNPEVVSSVNYFESQTNSASCDRMLKLEGLRQRYAAEPGRLNAIQCR